MPAPGQAPGTPSQPAQAPQSSPDPELLARLARLGVALGTGALPAAPRPPAGAGSGAGERPDGGMPAGQAKPRPDFPRPDADLDEDLPLPLERVVPGATIENAEGACYLSVERHPAETLHGGEALGAALGACSESLAALAGDPRLAGMDMARAAFVDTETTGLGGGAGTFAFLIGVGRFVDGQFELRQFFMRDPAEERAQLAAIEDWVSDCSGVVSFNGRSFDLPLLAARYALHRRSLPLNTERHLDLLAPARRLWRRRLPSCALSSLERHLFGIERQGDVPGWLIPYRYRMYLAEGDARWLAGIFPHNALDILSMVSLVSRMARAYRRPEAALEHAADWLSLAQAYERAGDPARAMAACEDALARGLPPAEADEALYRLSMLAKRGGDPARALAIWSELAGGSAPRRLYPFEELAKHWEHRAEPRDPARALALAEEARALVEAGSLRPRRGRRAALEALDHRIGRLRRKLG